MSQIIKMHSEEDLFAKKKYGWTGSTSLSAYIISETSSHYDWAFKRIKRGGFKLNLLFSIKSIKERNPSSEVGF